MAEEKAGERWYQAIKGEGEGMNKTSIEWVKNPDGSQGYTWNPITGCLNGCSYCYARRLANGRLKQRYLANDNIANPIATGTRDEIEEEAMEKLSDPFYPRFWHERVERLMRCENGKPKGIFTCDMSELFGDWIPNLWQEAIFHAIRCQPSFRFYLLTKQPQNLAKFSPFPENCWVGVTVTADGDMTKAYYGLSNIEAKVKYISCEPLLGAITMKSHRILKEVDWVIIGAQTKPYRPPQIEWVQEIVSAADHAGTSVFLKDNLKPLLDEHRPDESDIQPNHDKLLRMKHPFFCKDCDGEWCHKCGVIWGLRQEMPK